MSATPETNALYAQMLAENPGNFIHLEEFLELACRLERERDEAREAAAKWESSSDAMERAGAEQARRADENREWALRAERERDEARTVLERIVKLSINARRVEEDYAEWEKAVLAILDICEERKEK